jgi:hypothetical protein
VPPHVAQPPASCDDVCWGGAAAHAAAQALAEGAHAASAFFSDYYLGEEGLLQGGATVPLFSDGAKPAKKGK